MNLKSKRNKQPLKTRKKKNNTFKLIKSIGKIVVGILDKIDDILG